MRGTWISMSVLLAIIFATIKTSSADYEVISKLILSLEIKYIILNYSLQHGNNKIKSCIHTNIVIQQYQQRSSG